MNFLTFYYRKNKTKKTSYLASFFYSNKKNISIYFIDKILVISNFQDTYYYIYEIKNFTTFGINCNI